MEFEKHAEAQRLAYEASFDYFKVKMRDKDELIKFISSPNFHKEEAKKRDYAIYMSKVNSYNVKKKVVAEIQPVTPEKPKPVQEEFKPVFMKKRLNPPPEEPPETLLPPIDNDNDYESEYDSEETPRKRVIQIETNLYDKYRTQEKKKKFCKHCEALFANGDCTHKPNLRISKRTYGLEKRVTLKPLKTNRDSMPKLQQSESPLSWQLPKPRASLSKQVSRSCANL